VCRAVGNDAQADDLQQSGVHRFFDDFGHFAALSAWAVVDFAQYKTKLDKIYQPPSAEHWMGTVPSGRDIFSQIVHGGKDVIYVAAVAALLSTLIAVTFGTVSAFAGGSRTV
jgi:ABC-type dipeptide/oligopeptide/nickel transport system permease subunit